MNFAPYHAFRACRTLEASIEALRARNAVPAGLYGDHERYHYSLVHKLRSARYHVDTLGSFLSSDAAQAMTPTDLVYRVNFHFDGFLHVVGSATDIFAREVLTYFGLPLPARVYYHTAESELTTQRPGDAVLPFVSSPTWKQEFGEYRNTATHESIIGTQYTIVVEARGKSFAKRVVFPVPDDPRASTPQYRNNPDIVAYCHRTFKRVVSHFNQAYEHLNQRIHTSAALPL